VSVTDTLQAVDRNIATEGAACLADDVELVDMATGSVVRGSDEVAARIRTSLPRMDDGSVRLTVDEGRVAAEWPASNDAGPVVCVYEVETGAIVSIRVYADQALGRRRAVPGTRTNQPMTDERASGEVRNT
jgi:hypothetical protein